MRLYNRKTKQSMRIESKHYHFVYGASHSFSISCSVWFQNNDGRYNEYILSTVHSMYHDIRIQVCSGTVFSKLTLYMVMETIKRFCSSYNISERCIVTSFIISILYHYILQPYFFFFTFFFSYNARNVCRCF